MEERDNGAIEILISAMCHREPEALVFRNTPNQPTLNTCRGRSGEQCDNRIINQGSLQKGLDSGARKVKKLTS
jgi:hypothetical protein